MIRQLLSDMLVRQWNHKEMTNKFKYREHQFDFMLAQGLKSHHYMLDIGCGWLRAGLLFIQYLDDGHYYAMEKDWEVLAPGIGGLIKYDFLYKQPVLFVNNAFAVSSFKRKFDFVLAQSVFTHIETKWIKKCIGKVIPVLEDGGRFYATFWPHHRIYISEPHKARKNEYERSMQPLSFYEEVCKEFDCKIECIGEWGHPAGQYMLCFSKL